MHPQKDHPIKRLRSLISAHSPKACSLRDFANQLEGVSFSQIGRVERFELPVSKSLSQKIQQTFGAWVAPGHYYPAKKGRSNVDVSPLKSEADFIPKVAFDPLWDRFSRRAESLGRGVALHLNGGNYKSIDELAEDCFRTLKETRGMRGTGKVRVFPSAISLDRYTKDTYDDFRKHVLVSQRQKDVPGGAEIVFTPALDAESQYIISLLLGALSHGQIGSDEPTLINLKQSLRDAMNLKQVTDAQHRSIDSFRKLFVLDEQLPHGVEETQIKELMWANKVWTHPGEVPSPPPLLEWFNQPTQLGSCAITDYENQGMPAPLWLMNYQQIRPAEFTRLVKLHRIDRRLLNKVNHRSPPSLFHPAK